MIKFQRTKCPALTLFRMVWLLVGLVALRTLSWLHAVLIGIDQLANTLFYPLLNLGVQKGGYFFGKPDETLSSVMGKNSRTNTCRFCYWMCHALNWIDRDHCRRSIEYDE